jgi:hypothetical protein
VRQTWTAAEILDGLRAFERAHGRPPKMRELHDTRGTPYPPATAVVRTFGAFRAALAELDQPAGENGLTATDVSDPLRAHTHEHDARRPALPSVNAAKRR